MALGAQLQFKMGRFKNGEELVLNNVAKKAGTVYVTTDEKAMYVDVDDSTRIRIGDIIQLNSVREAQPPFSQDALYYFIEENALLKWTELFKKNEDGTKESLGMGWQQLNSISDVTANLSSLTNKVTEIEGVVNTLNGAASVKGSVAEAKAAANKAQGDATQALADAANAKSQADKGVADAATAQKKADDNAIDITGLKNRLTTAEGTITSNTTLAQKGVNDAAAAQGTANTAVEKANKAQTDATQALADAKAAQDKADDNADSISNLGNRMTAAENAVTKAQTDATNALTEIGVPTATGQEASGLYAKVEAAQAQADKGVSDAAAAQSKADQAYNKADTNATNITGLGNRLDALEPKVTTVEGKVKTIEETTIPGLTEDISELRADLGTRGADEKDAFTRIKDLENTLGGSVEGGSVLDKLSTIDQTVTSHGTAITELQGASTSQGNKITNLEGKVGAPAEGETPSSGLFALVDGNAEAIEDHETRIDKLEEDLPKLANRVADAEDDIKSINTTLNGLDEVYVNEDDYATDKAALEAKIDEGLAEINENINAANAMTYKGPVKTYADLPTSKVKVGDTYVIATDGGFTEGNEVYYAGDLLVATGTEYEAEDFTPDENGNLSAEDKALIGTIKGEVKWNHVTTGYVATHNPELKAVDSETENAIDIRLSSFSGKEINAGDLGKFKIVGGENVKVSITEGEIPVITIGMAWDTF